MLTPFGAHLAVQLRLTFSILFTAEAIDCLVSSVSPGCFLILVMSDERPARLFATGQGRTRMEERSQMNTVVPRAK